MTVTRVGRRPRGRTEPEPAAPTPAPLSLSDRQLGLVMTASAALPFAKRSVLLERIAAQLRRQAGRPRDADVAEAVQRALQGLRHEPAAALRAAEGDP
jgi:hypothetical protein